MKTPFSARGLCLTLFVLALAIRLAAQNVPGPKPIPATGMENVFQLSPHVYSGSAPEGEAGFAQLQKLGIKTILSVDGAKPEVELAHKYGLRYVHLPHGYDGIGADVQAGLIKAAQASADPIFIHCHHGKHRGPTAAAVICMANEGWSLSQAQAWLATAGTATNYVGLFATVRNFQPPTADTLAKLPASFPEVAQVSGLVDAMVAIDEQWEHLKAVRKADYHAPKDHPDIQPSNEAVILWEHFRESQRLPASIQRGASFVESLQSTETSVHEVEALLRQYAAKPAPALREQLDRRFDALNQSCVSCHKQHRDAVRKF